MDERMLNLFMNYSEKVKGRKRAEQKYFKARWSDWEKTQGWINTFIKVHF
jgi:hypothetical protein